MQVSAFIPIKKYSHSKGRLASILSEQQRSDLSKAMATQTIKALIQSNACDSITLVTNDPHLIIEGASTYFTESSLNQALNEKIILVISLLKIAADEYSVGIIDGAVENKYEYQDALGFTMIAKDIMVNFNTEDNSKKTRVMKIVKVIDSLSVLWPKLVPTENIDGSYKIILDAVKEIENV